MPRPKNFVDFLHPIRYYVSRMYNVPVSVRARGLFSCILTVCGESLLYKYTEPVSPVPRIRARPSAPFGTLQRVFPGNALPADGTAIKKCASHTPALLIKYQEAHFFRAGRILRSKKAAGSAGESTAQKTSPCIQSSRPSALISTGRFSLPASQASVPLRCRAGWTLHRAGS